MWAANFADCMGLAFVHEMQGCINGMPVVFHRPFPTSITLIFHPSLKLVSKGSRMWTKHHTNPKSNF